MALSTLPIHRRTKVVYGKAASRSRYGSYLSDEEEMKSGASNPSNERRHAVKDVREAPPKSHALKHPLARDHRADAFDVPSSEDESAFPVKTVSPPRLKPRKPAVQDIADKGSQLTAWERARLNDLETSRSREAGPAETSGDTPDAQLLSEELNYITQQRAKSQTVEPVSTVRKRVRKEKDVTRSSDEGVTSTTSSAAARFAARRKQAGANNVSPLNSDSQASASILKRPALIDVLATARKRTKTVTNLERPGDDVDMTDRSSTDPAQLLAQVDSKTTDVFDFPESSADESLKSQSIRVKVKPIKQAGRRGKLATSVLRRSPKKSVSAPARLTEMVTTDTDTPEPTTRSPSLEDIRLATPQLPSTPTSTSVGSPQTAIKDVKTMTPKQARLWNRLLPNESSMPSPSTLPLKDLAISEIHAIHRQGGQQSVSNPKEGATRRRIKLVDRLKASAPPSGNEDEDDSDIDMSNSAPLGDLTHVESINETQQSSASASASQGQTRNTTSGRPKITYSSARSFLPEDSLEDELMLGLMTDLPRAATRSSSRDNRPGAAPKNSDFDLDDSDGGGGGGKLQTIHELRNSGRNRRTMQDIDGLFSDIENHNASNRSRRRSALAELATKLTDKSFAERFLGHSFELQLISECTAAPDQIADFGLAAAFLVLLLNDLPEHSVSTMNERGVLDWLGTMLSSTTQIDKLVKDRSSNMSKVSQASFVQFAEVIRNNAQIFEGKTPPPITPRLVALKGLEQLVKKLRQSGNKTQLLSPSHCTLILPAIGDAPGEDEHLLVEQEISVSLLEHLSTSPLTLQWPPETIPRISQLLPQLQQASPKLRNILFLTLRLCLNLTNVDVHNCDMLATRDVVRTLLQCIRNGFSALELEDKGSSPESGAILRDLLVLAIGVTINLAEHSDKAREYAKDDESLLGALVVIFQQGQERMLEAESVEESISNVAFGYLAVALANLCQNASTRAFIASKLPKQNLQMLVEAVAEFVAHHQKVDTMNFDGEEGSEVWGAFTEKLRAVLQRLKTVAGEN